MMAVDGHTLIGTRDHGIPASSTHDRMTVRGDTDVTVPWHLLQEAIESQVLPQAWIDRLITNEDNPSAHASQTESDLDYKIWRDELQQSVSMVRNLAQDNGEPSTPAVISLQPRTAGRRWLAWPAATAGLIAAGILALVLVQDTTEDPGFQIKGTAKVYGTAQRAGPRIVVEAVISHAGRLSLFSAPPGRVSQLLAQSELEAGGKYVLYGRALPFDWVPRHDLRPHASLESTTATTTALVFILESPDQAGHPLTPAELIEVLSRSPDQEHFQHQDQAGRQIVVHRVTIRGRIDAP